MRLLEYLGAEAASVRTQATFTRKLKCLSCWRSRFVFAGVWRWFTQVRIGFWFRNQLWCTPAYEAREFPLRGLLNLVNISTLASHGIVRGLTIENHSIPHTLTKCTSCHVGALEVPLARRSNGLLCSALALLFVTKQADIAVVILRAPGIQRSTLTFRTSSVPRALRGLFAQIWPALIVINAGITRQLVYNLHIGISNTAI